MPNPFDETLKHLVELQPAVWLQYVGLPVGQAEIIDADLSTLTAEADKVIRVRTAKPSLVHLEFQSGYDPELADRTLLYNVLLRNRHKLSVRSVVILLRRKADGAKMTGGIRDADPNDGELIHDFRYRILRVWERAVEETVTGPLATLPLAPLSKVTRAELPGVIEQMQERIRRETSAAEARELWSATYILMGLRYAEAFTLQMLRGVQEMEDSVTYQAIIRKGEARGEIKGRLEERHDVLMQLGGKRFGPPDASVQAALESITDLKQLERLTERLLEVESWQELLG
jgi:predicted transposase YdaD